MIRICVCSFSAFLMCTVSKRLSGLQGPYACTRTCIPAYLHTAYMHASMHSCIHTCMLHECIQADMYPSTEHREPCLPVDEPFRLPPLWRWLRCGALATGTILLSCLRRLSRRIFGDGVLGNPKPYTLSPK